MHFNNQPPSFIGDKNKFLSPIDENHKAVNYNKKIIEFMLCVLSKTAYLHTILISFTMTQALLHKDILECMWLYKKSPSMSSLWGPLDSGPVSRWQTGKRGKWGSSLLAACPVGTTVGFQPPSRWITNKSLGLCDLIPCDIATGGWRKRGWRERKTGPVLNFQVN